MNRERLSPAGSLTTECVSCHRQFTINSDEIKFFRDKGLNLPKRCPVCRRLKRAKKSNDGHRPAFTPKGLLNVFEEE